MTKPARSKLAFVAKAVYMTVMTFLCGLLLLLLVRMAFDVFDPESLRETTEVVVTVEVAAPPIDQFTDRLYVEPPWKYRHFRATRSAGQRGTLYHGGRDLGQTRSPLTGVNDYYDTPWGVMYWHGTPGIRWLPHGWMPFPSWRFGPGQLLPDPGVQDD